MWPAIRLRHLISSALLCAWLASPAFAGETVPLSISSPAFVPMGGIPARYTCEGKDMSPPLSFAHVSNATQSLALIVDDPDAPGTGWVHWVVYNIPPDVSGTGEGAGSPIAGALEGNNSWKRGAYGGPCPPTGRHRYFFRLYALDTLLPDLYYPTKAELERAIQGHIIEQATLIGTYRKRH